MHGNYKYNAISLKAEEINKLHEVICSMSEIIKDKVKDFRAEINIEYTDMEIVIRKNVAYVRDSKLNKTLYLYDDIRKVNSKEFLCNDTQYSILFFDSWKDIENRIRTTVDFENHLFKAINEF